MDSLDQSLCYISLSIMILLKRGTWQPSLAMDIHAMFDSRVKHGGFLGCYEPRFAHQRLSISIHHFISFHIVSYRFISFPSPFHHPNASLVAKDAPEAQEAARELLAKSVREGIQSKAKSYEDISKGELPKFVGILCLCHAYKDIHDILVL